MADNGTPRSDPFEFWRQFYEANEQAWTRAIKDMVTTEGYAEAQGKMLETFLGIQGMMRDTMTAQLANLNIPTRDDVARIGELVISLEEKFDLLDDRVASVEARLMELKDAGAQSAERAIKGLTGLEKKVAQLEARSAGSDERGGKSFASLEKKVGHVDERMSKVEEHLLKAVGGLDKKIGKVDEHITGLKERRAQNGATESRATRSSRAPASPRAKVAGNGNQDEEKNA